METLLDALKGELGPDYLATYRKTGVEDQVIITIEQQGDRAEPLMDGILPPSGDEMPKDKPALVPDTPPPGDSVNPPAGRDIILRIPQEGTRDLFHQLKASMRRRRSGRAVVSYDGKYARFAMAGMTIGALAAGYWPGTANIALAALMAMAAEPPKDDPLVLRVEEGHLHFGPNISCECRWHPDKQ